MPIDFEKIFAQLGKPQASKEEVHRERVENTEQLVHDIIGRHAEYFADPANRLAFIKDQSAKDFYRMARHINAKLRGEKPHQLRRNPQERAGGTLPMLHTPAAADKLRAFGWGFRAIQDYLNETDDSIEKQIEGAAMATEALIIWVHPFTDGNGRTSRFMAKLIESGASDIDELVQETASDKNRRMYYSGQFATKESRLEDADNDNLILDSEEREAMRQSAEVLPTDVEGMALSIKHLIENDDVRSKSASSRPGFKKAS